MKDMRQFDNITTFFDLGIDTEDFDFATLYCIMGDTYKKRNNITKLALTYLLNKDSLNAEEILIAESILDDSYYQKPKKYDHCKICSSEFKREVIVTQSNNYKYWEICFPSVPYFPGNMMIYLKDRFKNKKENFQNLTIDELIELKLIIKNMKELLNDKLFYGDLVGINVLFNQISKSQLCIHGHVELMIKSIDKLGLGCQLLKMRQFDTIANIINDKIQNENGVLKTLEGIRVDFSKFTNEEVLNKISEHENLIFDIINMGKDLRTGKRKPNNEQESLLMNGMSPAPTNSIYLTDYRNRLFVSSVPEVIPETINLEQIGNLDDEENMYLTKYNATTPNKDFSVMRKYSPFVRPSSKVTVENETTENVKILRKNIQKVLEG